MSIRLKAIKKAFSTLILLFTNFYTYSQVYGEELISFDFSNGIPENWERSSDSGIGLWEYRGPFTTPDNTVASRGSCGAQSEPLESTTTENGFVIFDSNYWDDEIGPCGNIGSGIDPGPHSADLTTSSLDFTNENSLVLTFQQQYKNYQGATSVSISIDGGNSYTSIIENSAQVGFYSGDLSFASVNISAIAANQPDVRIRFHFEGLYYYWMIDDIVIYKPNNNDIFMPEARYTAFDFNQGFSGIEKMEYSIYPRTMISPFQFHADALNIGNNTQTAVTLTAKIFNQSEEQLAVLSSIPTSIPAGESSIIATEEYLPSEILGSYNIEFQIDQAEEDEDEENNFSSKSYKMSEHTFARDKYEMDGEFTPANQFTESHFELGNYFEGIITEPLKCTSISVAFSENSSVGATTNGLILNLLRDSVLAETLPYEINQWDLNQVGEAKFVTLQLIEPYLITDTMFLASFSSFQENGLVRIATSGISPAQTTIIEYPSENAIFYTLTTPMIRVNIFPLSSMPGCTNFSALNFDPLADIDDGSCRIAGCTNQLYPNFDSLANFENGSCEMIGCTDSVACNFNSSANTDDNSCILPVGCDTCSGETDGTGTVINNDGDGDGICDADEIAGCTDNTACNYDEFNVITDDGPCIFPVGCDTCSGNPIDGTGFVVDNDTDSDGICNDDEVLGCQDSTACNYNVLATDDDSCVFVSGCESCSGNPIDGTGFVVDNDNDGDGICNDDEVLGCTNSTSFNYDENATDDDGSCEYFVFGCLDETACNYNFNANTDDELAPCIFPVVCESCSGEQDGTGVLVDNDNDGDGICDSEEIIGCTDILYLEYDQLATDDDGSCATLVVEGCTDSFYLEFNPNANVDDGTCATLVVEGCTDSNYLEYDSSANTDDGSCATLVVEGCTNSFYLEFDSNANVDDGSCLTLLLDGCTDSTACNYDSNATDDNGSCTYSTESYLDCNGNCVNDTDGDGICDEVEIAGCTDSIACDYDSTATDDNGSCTYPTESYLDCNGDCLNDTDGDEVCDEAEINGCTDTSACNYDLTSTDDDGSCTYPTETYLDCNGDCLYDSDDDGVCDEAVLFVNEEFGCAPFSIEITNLTPLNEWAECSFNLGEGTILEVCELDAYVHTYDSPGVYTITYSYTVDEFISTDEVTITVYEAETTPTLEYLNEINQIVCTNCVSDNNYNWILDNITIIEDAGFDLLNPENGTYILELDNGSNCTAQSFPLIVTSIKENIPELEISIYPNPTSEFIQILNPFSSFNFQIIDSSGKVVTSGELSSPGLHRIDFKKFSSGVYLLKSANRTYKIIKT
ncbi:MAG: T9SS type A sorting domain-containing protein [Flavobacteriales bacterium]